ncbi:MAG: NAD(P)(+) transhydrogenase (Re/Si-specific) subunit beta, partial [Gammaproteobacteria bacterium]|nr:NAD(P)(+) transhydrogenase (Re/Si-specific) subunit beta [Gammaproteobacteria bacterium]
MSEEMLINLVYVASAVMFIFGLKLLGSPDTARRGNFISAVGMLCAVIVTLIDQNIVEYQYIVGGIVAGGLIGALVARMVAMTSMPEMVALFNGFGGLASLLVGWAALAVAMLNASDAAPVPVFMLVTVFLSILIGGLTFTGSLLAYGKLSERISGKPFVYTGQRVVNSLILLAVIVCAGLFVVDPSNQNWLYLAVGLALLLGVSFVLPIGGADMPVVISLLNSFSGIAAASAGFAISNILLIVAGSLVGASGIILTNIMCKAMNRSLSNVLFSG